MVPWYPGTWYQVLVIVRIFLCIGSWRLATMHTGRRELANPWPDQRSYPGKEVKRFFIIA